MTTTAETVALELPAHRWREPSRSVATRRRSGKSKAACRPILVTDDWRELLCESELEAAVALVLMARPDCARLVEQPAGVGYVDASGKVRHHTFDFLLELHSGRRVAVAAKPQAIADQSGLAGLLKRVAAQVDPAFADGVLLVTDAMLSRQTVANARLLHDSRRNRNPIHDRLVRDVAASLNGAASIEAVRRAAGLEAHDQGFYAVVRAVGDGVLAVVSSDLVCPGTLVRRSFSEDPT